MPSPEQAGPPPAQPPRRRRYELPVWRGGTLEASTFLIPAEPRVSGQGLERDWFVGGSGLLNVGQGTEREQAAVHGVLKRDIRPAGYDF